MSDAATIEETPDKTDELIEAVAEVAPHRDQRVHYTEGDFEFDKTYTQRPLSFFGKLEFTKITARGIKKLADAGSSIGDITGANVTSVEDLREQNSIDVLVNMLTSLAMEAPDLLMEIYMISLNIPSYERQLVAEIWEKPVSEDGGGGLTDEDGLAIMNTFIDQNGKVLADFFRLELPKVVKNAQEAMGLGQTPESSKPSKRSARSTRKAS